MNLKDKLSIYIPLILFFGLMAIFLIAMLGTLLQIDSRILINRLIEVLGYCLCIIGIWLLLPVKMRITLEAFTLALTHTNLTKMGNTSNPFTSKTLLSNKLTSPIFRISGLVLLILGIGSFYFG